MHLFIFDITMIESFLNVDGLLSMVKNSIQLEQLKVRSLIQNGLNAKKVNHLTFRKYRDRSDIFRQLITV